MEKSSGEGVSEEGLLYDFLSGNLGLTKREISQAKFRTDGVCVNGRRARVTAMLQAGDVVEVKLEEAETQSGHLVPYAGKPDILYEDEDILLVNKPAGVVVHPSHGHYSDSLANMLVQYFMEKGEQVKIRSVGRLDKETSGIVVLQKIRRQPVDWHVRESWVSSKGILCACPWSAGTTNRKHPDGYCRGPRIVDENDGYRNGKTCGNTLRGTGNVWGLFGCTGLA